MPAACNYSALYTSPLQNGHLSIQVPNFLPQVNMTHLLGKGRQQACWLIPIPREMLKRTKLSFLCPSR